MPIRLMVVLAVSCLVPAFVECAAPFVAPVSDPILPQVDPKAASAVPETGAAERPNPVRDGPLSWSNLVRFSLGSTRPQLSPDTLRISSVDVFDASPFFPIHDGSWNSLWVYPFGKGPSHDCFGRSHGTPNVCLADVSILRPAAVPTASLPTRSMNLLLETAGVGPWQMALVEVWITRDGWNWHLFQRSLQTDSLRVDLPEEGRYGLRLVVHDLKAHASPTPRAGEAPQLWVEADEGCFSLGLPVRSFLDGRYETRVYGEHRYTYHHTYWEFDQPGTVKQVKRDGLHHPCGYITRIETESLVWYAGGYAPRLSRDSVDAL